MEKVGYEFGINPKKKINAEHEWKRSPFDIQTNSNFYDESISK